MNASTQPMCDPRPAALGPHVMVNGVPVATDSEGYLCRLDDWSEDFARALAVQEVCHFFYISTCCKCFLTAGY